jgi:hypothetical protein
VATHGRLLYKCLRCISPQRPLLYRISCPLPFQYATTKSAAWRITHPCIPALPLGCLLLFLQTALLCSCYCNCGSLGWMVGKEGAGQFGKGARGSWACSRLPCCAHACIHARCVLLATSVRVEARTACQQTRCMYWLASHSYAAWLLGGKRWALHRPMPSGRHLLAINAQLL